MSYFAPYIDETGMHIPTYQDIVDNAVASMKQIFGDDIYIDPDSQDYQQIAIFSKMVYDSYNLALLTYNNRTPNTAVGVGLDNVVVFADINRKPATASTVVVTLTGDAGTVINSGEVQDANGNTWLLPDTVTIPSNGTIAVTATSKASGAITALANTVTKIMTPVYGWTSVTNNASSSAGIDIESDFSLRGRFSLSTMSPASSIFESLYESLLALPAVTRVRGYENDTGATSNGTTPPNVPSGIPPHTVCFVVEGGVDAQVATELYLKKTPGTGTFGTTEVSLQSNTGNTFVIKFYRPTYTNVKVRVTVKKLPSYTEDYADKIKQYVSEYISEMGLAETIYQSVVWSVAVEAMDSKSYPAYSVIKLEFSTNGGSSWSTNDVVQQYYGAATCAVSDVTVVYA